ncbi:MAG: hypothetical protein WKF30_19645 [Pyrinomonadaceae bacterium]
MVGEEAKLGIRKPVKPRAAAASAKGDTTHTVRSDVRQHVPIPRAPLRLARGRSNKSG